jgi:osmotically inducible protein OsmC
MADIRRTAKAAWHGSLPKGTGEIGTESGVLEDERYAFGTRFEDAPGTNPEELIAAAHAACYSMAFAGMLGDKGYRLERIETEATCVLTRQEGGGWKITGMQLEVRGQVPDIDEVTFGQIAEEADKGCPVSNLLRSGLTIELDVALTKE